MGPDPLGHAAVHLRTLLAAGMSEEDELRRVLEGYRAWLKVVHQIEVMEISDKKVRPVSHADMEFLDEQFIRKWMAEASTRK